MSEMRTRSRGRLPRRTALLAALLAIAAIGVVGAPSASALGEQCSGGNVSAEGAYLQSQAQGIWAGSGKAGFNGTLGSTQCGGSQGSGGKPTVTFAGAGSAAALHGWGADDGTFHHPGIGFVATDEAPAGPVEEAGTALYRMKKALGSDLVVAPVTQTAVAIVANPPALPGHSACVVGQITESDLELVFAGTLTNWRQLSTASDKEAGGNCDQAVTRVVREEGSGTTYQFKHYLDQVEPETVPCTGKEARTWGQLQSSREPTEANLEWPSKAECQEGEGPVTVLVKRKEASGPLGFVAENHGTITYAPLPTAEQVDPEQVVKVYNGVNFVEPFSGEEEGEANCAYAEYALPSEWEAGVNVDWSQVYGSDPESGEGEFEDAYPICTLTWAVAAADSGGVFGEKVGTTVRDYLKYVADVETGQYALHEHWYRDLPEAVVTAAGVALNEIGGEGEEEKEEPTSTGTVLCKASPKSEAGVLICPPGERFAGEVTGTLMPETTATFESTAGPEGTIKCTNAELVGNFEEDGTSSPEGGITKLGFGTEGSPCGSSLPGEPELVLYLNNVPYGASRFVYLSTLAPQAAFVLAKEKGEAVELATAGAMHCFYRPNFLGGQVVNGSPTSLVTSGTWALFEWEGEECPEELRQSATLTVNRGGSEASVYVAGE